MDQITLLYQFTGLYMFGCTSLSAFIALIRYRKGEKWAWYTELVIGGITLLGQLFLVYIGANLLPSYFIPFNIILVTLWIVGIALPIKEFFS